MVLTLKQAFESDQDGPQITKHVEFLSKRSKCDGDVETTKISTIYLHGCKSIGTVVPVGLRKVS